MNLHEGWNEVGDLDILVEDGKVIRGTQGKGVNYRPVYPYSKNYGNISKNLSGISVKTYEKMVENKTVYWS